MSVVYWLSPLRGEVVLLEQRGLTAVQLDEMGNISEYIMASYTEHGVPIAFGAGKAIAQMSAG